MSVFSSVAYSRGSSRSTGLTKPLTIIVRAAASFMPRLRRVQRISSRIVPADASCETTASVVSTRIVGIVSLREWSSRTRAEQSIRAMAPVADGRIERSPRYVDMPPSREMDFETTSDRVPRPIWMTFAPVSTVWPAWATAIPVWLAVLLSHRRIEHG